MTPRMKELLEQQLERFRKKFGRDPGPGDPVFFDPDADEPTRMPDITDEVLAAMQRADLPPEFAYAFSHPPPRSSAAQRLTSKLGRPGPAPLSCQGFRREGAKGEQSSGCSIACAAAGRFGTAAAMNRRSDVDGTPPSQDIAPDGYTRR